MGSSNLNKQVVFDPIRSLWVTASPEELVRQKWIQHMIDVLGYPRALLGVEKAIHELPHLQGHEVPQRRLDLLCFAKGLHPAHLLYPLLLIECKAIPLGPEALNQLKGYNHHVRAPFIAVVNQTHVHMETAPGGNSYPFLPLFQELRAWAHFSHTP